MGRISKEDQIPSSEQTIQDELGGLLVRMAQRSSAIRMALVRVLVRPKPYFPSLPQIPDRDLVTAIRVTELLVSHALSRGQAIDVKRWDDMKERLTVLLRSQTRPPLLRKHARVAKPVVKAACEYWRTDWNTLENDLNQYENALLEKIPQGPTQSHRGRRFSEHHIRIVAAYELLRMCGEKGAASRVVQFLSEWGVKMEADSVWKLVARYQAALKIGKRAWIRTHRLPQHLLERIGWFFPPKLVRLLRDAEHNGLQGQHVQDFVNFLSRLARV